MQSDTAMIRAVVALFDNLGLHATAIEHLEQFEEWVTKLSDFELAAVVEFLSRRLCKRFEEVK